MGVFAFCFNLCRFTRARALYLFLKGSKLVSNCLYEEFRMWLDICTYEYVVLFEKCYWKTRPRDCLATEQSLKQEIKLCI